jgi:hypothetical protein
VAVHDVAREPEHVADVADARERLHVVEAEMWLVAVLSRSTSGRCAVMTTSSASNASSVRVKSIVVVRPALTTTSRTRTDS